ncbi:50S ribosomal protein L25 [bacterium]|nr:50S ribosomal protein L25 [bacterium]
MEQVALRAEAGRETGSRASRRLRRENKVPATVYGRGLDGISIEVDRRDLHGALHTDAGLNAVIRLDIDGTTYTTVAREIQRHPVRTEINHIDFVQIALDEIIQAVVGIEYSGEPEGALEGGIVETISNTVTVEALPMAIPSEIVLDISALDVGDSLRISDLPELDGVEYIDDPNSPLLTVIIPRAFVEEVPEEEEDLELLDEDGNVIEAPEGDEESEEEDAD